MAKNGSKKVKYTCINKKKVVILQAKLEAFMAQEEAIKLFEGMRMRIFFDDVEEQWYFCINDVVQALTDSADPADYFKKMRKRDAELNDFVTGTNCPPHQFESSDGKLHAVKCASLQDTLRIILRKQNNIIKYKFNMKKIFTILALAMISVWSWAKVNISVAPNVIDFGTVNLDANGEADSDWSKAVLSWSGLIPYCSVFVDTLEAPAATAGVEFRITSDDGVDYDSDYWYGGDEWNPATSPNVWVKFYAIEPGEYAVKYGFYSFEDEDWTIKSAYAELLVKVTVLEHGQTVGFENTTVETKAYKVVRDGKVLIIRNGEVYSLTGAKVE